MTALAGLRYGDEVGQSRSLVLFGMTIIIMVEQKVPATEGGRYKMLDGAKRVGRKELTQNA